MGSGGELDSAGWSLKNSCMVVLVWCIVVAFSLVVWVSSVLFFFCRFFVSGVLHLGR